MTFIVVVSVVCRKINCQHFVLATGLQVHQEISQPKNCDNPLQDGNVYSKRIDYHQFSISDSEEYFNNILTHSVSRKFILYNTH